MPPPRTEIAVAFTVREKFSWTLACLKRLYAFAGTPFTLYVVDGYYPGVVQAELDAFLATRQNVVRITAERYLYPSEAMNAVIERISEPYLFLLQNDVLIGRGTLQSLFETAREIGCDVVAPLVLDTDNGVPAVHRDVDKSLVYCEEAGHIHVTRSGAPAERHGRRRAYFFEVHSLFMTADAARAVWPLAPLSVHEHFDLSITLWKMNREAFLDQRARVLYMDTPPLPLRDIEVPYFRFRWDPSRARQSDHYVRSKWRIADLFDGMSFIARQFSALRPEAILTDYDCALESDPWPDVIPGG